jgi:hypothetical protein
VLRVNALERRRGEEPQIGGAHSRDEYVFITRDIVFCKAGEDYDGSAARDSWYPALIREPLHHSKQRAKCHVKLFWLDPSPRSPRSFQMNATPVAVRFESLLRDQVNRPLCIMAETAAGVVSYDDGIVVYELDEAICSMADELAGVWEAAGGVMEIEEHSDESDKDDDSDDRGGSTVARRQETQEVVRTVMARTMSGREAANNRRYLNYRQMNSGTTSTRRQPSQRQRRIGKEGNYDTCGKCGLRGDLLMCDNTLRCIESFHLECIGLAEVPEGQWHCPVCTYRRGT